MEQKRQTQVTDANSNEFQKNLYQPTVDLDQLTEKTIIAIDCQGWHLQELYPNKTVLGLETQFNIVDFKLTRKQFYQAIDSRNYDKLVWPKLEVNNAAVIFDHSPVLKYRSPSEINNILNTVCQQYRPNSLVVKLNLMHVDDNRLTDRFYNLTQFRIESYVVHEFSYTANAKDLAMKFYRAVDI